MNKIVYISKYKIGSPFPDIVNKFQEISKFYDTVGDDSMGVQKYVKFVYLYYKDNFGIELMNWWLSKDKTGRIMDESKFALFMLTYPDHIEKITYE